MNSSNSSDRFFQRLVSNSVVQVLEHLEAMQRDAHSPEYAHWKKEVDDIWKRIFEFINSMGEISQKESLETIRETWVSYITHYGMIDQAHS